MITNSDRSLEDAELNRPVTYAIRNRLDYSILSNAYDADLSAPCVSLFHDLCFTKP